MANVEKNFAWNIASFILWLQRFVLKKEELKRNRNFFATGDIQLKLKLSLKQMCGLKKRWNYAEKLYQFISFKWIGFTVF